MQNLKYTILVLVFIAISCRPTEKLPDTLINASHLEHLFHKVNMDNEKQFGVIWIYSNAPEYQLVTDEDEGYSCIDDASRALVFYCRQYKENPTAKNFSKIKLLSQFVFFMKAENNYYYNFLFPDDEINKTHINSTPSPNFWTWRAFYALSELCLLESDELDEIQENAKINLDLLVEKIISLFSANGTTITFEGIAIPKNIYTYGADQIALILAGLTNYYTKYPSGSIEKIMEKLGNDLCRVQLGDSETFPHNAFMSWRNSWHAWGNMQAYALLYSGRTIHVDQFIKAGLKEVDDFYPYCVKMSYLHSFTVTKPADKLSGSNIEKFPQIAYDISPMIFASLEAYHATGNDKYSIQAGELATWFLGNNPAKQVMYDRFTGRTFDGIQSENKVNYNSGAESTIESLLCLQAIESNKVAKDVVDRYIKSLE